MLARPTWGAQALHISSVCPLKHRKEGALPPTPQARGYPRPQDHERDADGKRSRPLILKRHTPNEPVESGKTEERNHTHYAKKQDSLIRLRHRERVDGYSG